MMKFEKSVTKYFVTHVQKHLEKFLGIVGRSEIPGSRVFRVDVDYRSKYFVIESACGSPIAWLYLERQREWHAYEVMQVYTDPEFRGQGLAHELYDAAIIDDDLMIASGKTQSKYSRWLWESFVKNDRYDLYAIDFKTLDFACPVFWDAESETIWSELKLYYTQNDPAYEQNRDVRLIATRKKE